jgi:LuxR family transcriptional regulator, regulator of acetate metabolism
MAQGSSSAGRDSVVTGATLRAVADLDCVDLAFAATVDPARASFVLDRFVGARAGTLRNVTSAVGRGLGGQCIGQRRPVAVGDYLAARGITHEFDRQVAGEGIRAIFAIPVLEGATVREVVYGAARRPASFSDRVIDRAAGLVRTAARATAGPGTAASEVGAELAQVAREVTDPALRRRLSELSARLTGASGAGLPGPRPGARPGLTPRELDVLAEVARGHGNAQVAARLGLSEQTVKSYLKSAMAKLDGHTRGEAVYRARAAGLLP